MISAGRSGSGRQPTSWCDIGRFAAFTSASMRLSRLSRVDSSETPTIAAGTPAFASASMSNPAVPIIPSSVTQAIRLASPIGMTYPNASL